MFIEKDTNIYETFHVRSARGWLWSYEYKKIRMFKLADFSILKSNSYNRFGVENLLYCQSNDLVGVTEFFSCEHKVFVKAADKFTVLTTKVSSYYYL